MTPLRFTPILKRIRWGGRRLGDLLSKPIGAHADYAESWEVCDHGDDQSRVADGPYAGWTLRKLVRERGAELFGGEPTPTQFPLLIKYLDAADRLSIQVHPNDEQAKRFDPNENGKTEAWVILHAEPGSKIYAGLKSGVDEQIIRDHIAAGTLAECLHVVAPRVGDCISIPAGTVHAIGEGVLLAEVQQSSDLTFRLDDWGRLGSDGRPRPLHIEEAISCIDFNHGPVDPVTPHRISDHCEQLVEGSHFRLRRFAGSKPFQIPMEKRFHVVMVLDGRVRLSGVDWELRRGDTILVPGSDEDREWAPQGSVALLDATTSELEQ